MDLASFQKEVAALTDSWADKKPELLMYLTEEVGELARALRKVGAKRWGHEDEEAGSLEDVTEELGDVLFLLARIALISGIDLEDAATLVLGKINLRVSQSGLK